MTDILLDLDLDFNRVLEEIERIGASSIIILPEQFRLSLLSGAQLYPYEQAEEIVGSGDQEVRQQ